MATSATPAAVLQLGAALHDMMAAVAVTLMGKASLWLTHQVDDRA